MHIHEHAFCVYVYCSMFAADVGFGVISDIF